jgi:hypothetical protein
MKARLIHLISPKIKVWLIIPSLLLITNLLIGFNGLYGQDSFEYLRYSRELHEFISGVSPIGKFFWPVLFPLAGALVSFIMPDIIALQTVSIIFYGLTMMFLHKILKYLYPDKVKEVNIYLFLFFSLSPFVLRYSSVVMSDAMAMCFITGFFYFFLLFRVEGNKYYYLLLVFFGLAAVNTRYASIAIVSIPLGIAFLSFVKSFNLKYFILSLIMILIVFLPDIILEFNGSHGLSGPVLIPEWSVKNFTRNEFFTASGYQSYTFPNILFVLSNFVNPGYIVAGILFLLMVKRNIMKKSFISLILIVSVAYALFLAGLTTQNSRFLLLTFPCVVILYSGSFFRFSDFINNTDTFISHNNILKRFQKQIPVILISGIFLIQILLFFRALRPAYKDSVCIKEIADRIKSYPDKTIYTFNIDMGLKAYKVKNEIINLWSERINNFRPGSLVLFNYVNSYRQWKDLNPMYNWERVNTEYYLLLIEKLPGGWNLYEIKN